MALSMEQVHAPQVSKFNILRAIFKFNQFDRDRWVAKMASSVSPGSLVLDVGAGSAPYRDLFKHCQYRTQDFGLLAAGQLMGGREYAPLDYTCDIRAIPVSDASFDVVLCTEVLEHVPEPLEAIREMFRILRPNGCAFLSAPLGSGLHQEPFHFYGGYTPYFYRYAIERAGGRVESIEPNGNQFRLFSQEDLRFASRSAPWRIRGPIWLRIAWAPVWALTAALAPLVALFTYFYGTDSKIEDFTVGYHVCARKN